MMLPASAALKEAVHLDQRYIRAVVTMYFKSGAVEFTSDDDLATVDILEETGADSRNPIGVLTANVCDVSFNNTDKRFSPNNATGPYYGQLKPNVKFTVTFVVETADDVFETVNGGTYYTGDWVANNSSGSSSVTGYDRLMQYLDKPVTPIPVQKNMSLRTAFETIFKDVGLGKGDYIIDSNVVGTAAIGWMPALTFGNAVQDLAEACFASVFTDKADKLHVTSLLSSSLAVTDSWTDDNQIFYSDNPLRYLGAYSTVKLTYYRPVIKKDKEILSMGDLTIPPGTTILEGLSLSNPVAAIDRVQLSGVINCKITAIDIFPETLTITIENTGAESEVAQLSIQGNIIEMMKQIHTEADAATIEDWGEKVLEFDNIYVQTKASAQALAQNILKIAKNPRSEYTVDYRGNPLNELMDIVQITSASDDIPPTSIVLTRIDLKYDGSLSASAVGRVPIQ